MRPLHPQTRDSAQGQALHPVHVQRLQLHIYDLDFSLVRGAVYSCSRSVVVYRRHGDDIGHRMHHSWFMLMP